MTPLTVIDSQTRYEAQSHGTQSGFPRWGFATHRTNSGLPQGQGNTKTAKAGFPDFLLLLNNSGLTGRANARLEARPGWNLVGEVKTWWTYKDNIYRSLLGGVSGDGRFTWNWTDQENEGKTRNNFLRQVSAMSSCMVSQ